jgi:hypothetical protein
VTAKSPTDTSYKPCLAAACITYCADHLRASPGPRRLLLLLLLLPSQVRHRALLLQGTDVLLLYLAMAIAVYGSAADGTWHTLECCLVPRSPCGLQTVLGCCWCYSPCYHPLMAPTVCLHV